jgi:hypothetical protein
MILEAEGLLVKPSKAFFNEIQALLGEDSVEIEL